MPEPAAESAHPVSKLSCWHLVWQAAVGRDFFVDPALYAKVRERLILAHGIHGRVLVDFLLLPNEIHVISGLPPGQGAGDVARAIGNVVSRWVRQSQPVRSPVLAGPHLASEIVSLDLLMNEVRMLAWRPVHLELCRTPSHYARGALRVTLGLTPRQGFDARWVLQLFGDTVPEARAALRKWLARRPTPQAWQEWELLRGLSFAPGSAGAEAPSARTVRDPGGAALVAAGQQGIDGAIGLLEHWVAVRLGLPLGTELRAGSDGLAAVARACVASLAVKHRLCSASALARRYGRAKATLSEQMKACRSRPGHAALLATPAKRIVEDVLAMKARASRAEPAAGSEQPDSETKSD
jgi:hypothetical protein